MTWRHCSLHSRLCSIDHFKKTYSSSVYGNNSRRELSYFQNLSGSLQQHDRLRREAKSAARYAVH